MRLNAFSVPASSTMAQLSADLSICQKLRVGEAAGAL
jgi:hypothetical protein